MARGRPYPGVSGAFIGGWFFSFLGNSAGALLGSLITATVGAMALLYVVRIAKKA